MFDGIFIAILILAAVNLLLPYEMQPLRDRIRPTTALLASQWVGLAALSLILTLQWFGIHELWLSLILLSVIAAAVISAIRCLVKSYKNYEDSGKPPSPPEDFDLHRPNSDD